MRFAWHLAWRYFRAGGVQTVLTLSGVAVGVSVYIFVSSLIDGLQVSLIDRVIGNISQVTIEPQDRDPKPLTASEGRVLAQVLRSGLRESKMADWRQVVAAVDAEPGITAVSPTVTVGGFAIKGQQTKPITFRGIVPERYKAIIDLPGRMKEGVYDVSGQRCLIGIDLAKDLGVGVGSIIRTRSAKNVELDYTVAGIFDSGVAEVNARSFYVSLPNAQRAGDLVGYINVIETKIADVFQANAVADRLAAKTGLKAESWMRQNKEFLAGLQGQSGSSNMIKTFVMVAVAFGIASVLAVTVVQRSREIGILKSMGARTGQIIWTFVLLGLFVGLIGSSVGVAAGSGLSLAVGGSPDDYRLGKAIFPILITPSLIAQAVSTSVVMGVLAAIAPARRAAKVNPVEVIRYG